MENSLSWFEKAKKVIPGGVSSPVRAFRHVDRPPVYFQSAEGPYLYDVEGKRYIDFCLGFGPHVLGHSPDFVTKAVEAQLKKGTSFGACHPGEVELARKILVSYPFLQKVRLVNTGTEAVMTAIRLARGATSRSKIIKFEGCYHGHSDGLLAKAGSGVAELSESSSKGVPDSIVAETLIAKYDDLSTVKAYFQQYPKDVAAVIVEPIPANDGLWIPTYEHIRSLCEMAKANGALVIFDEVITGFRLGLGGATAFFDLKPDLVTLGKAIGGGLPLAAVIGTEAIMNLLAPEGPVYQAGTFSGNILSVAAGNAAVTTLFEKRPEWNAFDKRSEAFAAEVKNLISPLGDVQMTSLGSIFWFRFGKPDTAFPPTIDASSKHQYAQLFSRALDEGVYLPPSPYEVCFTSFAHSDSVLADALDRLKRCVRKT